MIRNIYKWPDKDIIAAYNLILKKKSKLSYAKRATVIHIYKTKLNKSVLPIQQEMAKKSIEIIQSLIEKCLTGYFRAQSIIDEALSKVTLISKETGFDVLLTGVLIGEITVNFEKDTHSVNFKPNNN